MNYRGIRVNDEVSSLSTVNIQERSYDEPSAHWIRFFWWIRSVIYLWVRSKAFPKAVEELSLDADKPVCYVLNSASITDLMVLDHHCKAMKLPAPRFDIHQLNRGGKASYLFLAKSGPFQRKRAKKLPTELYKLVDKVEREQKDIQLIPVSVFWGRNAGTEEKSLFKLLFFDDEQGGWLQRFFLFFAQGRNVFCSFGKPISVLNFIQQERDLVGVTKKLRRVLRVHFHRQREVTVGPYIYDRRKMVHSILNSKSMRQFFEQEEKKGKPREKLEDQARRYIDEIAARQSPHVIRFFDVLLTWLFNKVYSGVETNHGESLRALAETHEIVYLPCHRSHMDYLLINYSLYSLGVMPPHTAAGVNLNFWPVGRVLRMGGAFFIRRSFGGNRLYGAIFAEYVNFLLMNGYPLCFYIEGGRSRTGRLLQPKLGMISMVVNSFRESPGSKPILFIPTFVTYDKLIEARSYFHELKGKTKRAESMWALLKAPKILAYEFGKAYINFGQPISLTSYLAENPKQESEDVVVDLSRNVMRHINQAIQVTPVSLFATALLALPRRAIAESEMLTLINAWVALLRAVPYDGQTIIPDADAKDLLKLAEKLAHFNRFEHVSGDVIYVNEKDCAFLNYYRCNVLPIFVIPSLIANLFSHYQAIDMDSMVKCVRETYRLLKNDLFLKWQDDEVDAVIHDQITAMLNHGFLLPVGEKIGAPHQVEERSFHLLTLGRVLGNRIERFCLYISLLELKDASGKIAIESFSKECEGLAKKSSILSGYHEYDYFDKNECKNFIDTLSELGYVKKQDGFLEVLDAAHTYIHHLSPLSNAINKTLRGSGKETYERTQTI